jgi:2-oxo-hept-3-ene-1,7-dioate hydratase
MRTFPIDPILNATGTSSTTSPIELGKASAVLGNPDTAVACLANKLSGFGVTFAPGDVVLTGSFVIAIPVASGDEIHCALDQGLGSVQVSFA